MCVWLGGGGGGDRISKLKRLRFTEFCVQSFLHACTPGRRMYKCSFARHVDGRAVAQEISVTGLSSWEAYSGWE